MLELTPLRAFLAAGTLVTGAALVAPGDAARRGMAPEPAAVHAALPHPPTKSLARVAGEAEAKALQREIRGLSLAQVRAALPAEHVPGFLYLKFDEDRTALLFRRLGELRGEEALEELYRRYEARNRTFAATAMTQALVGWMRSDREAALAAFRGMLRPDESINGLLGIPGLWWKGTSLASGIG